MKILAVIAFFALAIGTLANSHPDAKNNGLGSARFPNHYASPTHPTHP